MWLTALALLDVFEAKEWFENKREDAFLSLDSVQTDSIVPPIPLLPPPLIDHSVPDSFPCLRAALKTADSTIVRIVHYGDSQIEEDRISMTIRRYLQGKYGGHGVGLIPLFQSIPTITLDQRTFPKPAQRYLVYGPQSLRSDTSLYGFMGQVSIPDTTTLVTLRPRHPKESEGTFSRIKVFADSTYVIPATDSVRIKGHQAVYGLSLESSTGVIVDNVPMRGCAGYVFTSIDRQQLSRFYQTEQVKLIILQYGGNALPSMSSGRGVSYYVAMMRKNVRYLKQCAPQSDFLFIGPSDMLTLKDGEWQSMDFLPLMDSELSRMAQQEGIAYFSLYQAMGGKNRMKQWQEKGLAGEDGIHFYRSGANKAAKMLLEWMKL